MKGKLELAGIMLRERETRKTRWEEIRCSQPMTHAEQDICLKAMMPGDGA